MQPFRPLAAGGAFLSLTPSKDLPDMQVHYVSAGDGGCPRQSRRVARQHGFSSIVHARSTAKSGGMLVYMTAAP